MAGHAYTNAYKILHDVRHGVNEYSATLWAGTDTSGLYTNEYLLEKINAAQARIYALVMKTEARQIFYEEASLTGVNSVFTLPWDFGRLLQFEDERGFKVHPTSAKNKPISGVQGSSNLYFRDGNTYILTQSGITQTYTLKYYKKPRLLTFGIAAASSGANSLLMENSALVVRRDDYYNGFLIDNYTQAKTTTITDFTASTRAATTTSGEMTWASADVYGTVSNLPEEFHLLIAPFAAILAKAQHPASQEPPTKIELATWGEMLMEVIVGFVNEPDDIPIEDIFTDFGREFGGGGYSIPGHTSLV